MDWGKLKTFHYAAETGSLTALLAPAALQASLARSTADACPAITTWPGAL